MKVIVASTNPVKINAVQQAFTAMFPDVIVTVEGAKGGTEGLPDQPMGDDQTRDCAYARVTALKQRQPDADMWCGIEGGVAYRANANGQKQMECMAWIVFEDKDGRASEARTGTFLLPQSVTQLIEQGVELGHANDQVFHMHNSKQGLGMIGTVTDGLIDRTAYYVHAVILALVPFKNAGIYFETTTQRKAANA